MPSPLKLPAEHPPVYTPAPTRDSLLTSKRKELLHQLTIINNAAIHNGALKRPYNMQGNVEDLRTKVAFHYGIDLTEDGATSASTNAGTSTPHTSAGGKASQAMAHPNDLVNAEIINGQWDALVALGDELIECERKGETFVLWTEGEFHLSFDIGPLCSQLVLPLSHLRGKAQGIHKL